MIIVIMGVSGAGKSVVADRVSHLTGLPMVEADVLHTAGNISKMRDGVPLNDEERWPWLDRVREAAVHYESISGGAIVACSALRRAYRQRLAQDGAHPFFVFLNTSRSELERRLATRGGHFVGPSLLPSQVETLEVLAPDEQGTTVDGDNNFEQICRDIADLLEYEV